MFYRFNTQQPVKKGFSIMKWGLIPIVLGIFILGFATNTIDDGFIFVKNSFSSIHDILYEMSHRSQKNLTIDDNINYLEGIPIESILRGQDNYYVDEFASIPQTSAVAYVVGDAITGEIILEKNSSQVLPIASITKLMTASVALEEFKETQLATVSKRATMTESSRGMLRANEKLEVSDLLYPLLLVSSNDAAEVLAETLGKKYFIQNMNQKAQEIGMINTSFDDPSGLSEKNISTARDLFNLTEYLYNKHDIVFEITKLKQYTQGGRVWNNANSFAGTPNYEGGKTGYTSKAHRTGVALFTIPFEGYGDRVIAVTLLKTDNRAEDYNKLLTFVQNNVNYSLTNSASVLTAYNKTSDETSLTFLGDLMFDRGVKSSVYKNFGGDYTQLFANLKELHQSDIVFANLEGPISNNGTNVGSKYSFRFEPIVASVLKQAGIDVVSFANNHAGDWSLSAFKDTLTHLQDSGILFIGAGKTKQQAREVLIIESRGIKLGFLGFSDVGPEWIQATIKDPGILLASDQNRLLYIEEAKKKVDILVVSYHWGEEYKSFNERQTSLAHSSIDAGADIIIGHHPHVTQDIELYKSGIIAYSLGNAIFDQNFSEETMNGMLLSVDVNKNGIVGYQEKTFELNTKYQPQKPAIVTVVDKESYLANIGNEEEVHRALEKIDPTLCPETTTKDTNFILLNPTRKTSLSKTFVPIDLVPIPEELIPTRGRNLCITKETLLSLYSLYKDAKEDGIDIVPTSGFRNYSTQDYLFKQAQEKYREGQIYLSVAEAGHSEHQIGTTLDLTSKEIDYESASEKFETTATYSWLSKHATDYGFVQSYKVNTEEITGYIPESWHWRYLGPEHALAIKNLGLTTTEYLADKTLFGG